MVDPSPSAGVGGVGPAISWGVMGHARDEGAREMLYEIRLTRGDNYTSTVVDGPDMTGLARACPIEVRDYASMLAATWGEPGENMAPTTVEIATYRPVHLRQRTVTPARADIWLAWTVN